MRIAGVASVVGHVILSLVLVVLIFATTFAALFIFADHLISGPESPVLAAGGYIAVGLAGGALIAQWHRRVSIGTRLRSFAVVCAAIVPLALAFVLLPISLAFTLGMVLVYAGITGALITLKTIDFPWPIPLARIWRGEIGLAKTYWVWIMLVGTSILWTMMLISQLLYEFTGALFIVALKMAFSLIFSVVLVVSVWRSARNYEGPWRWRVLARVACVLSGVLAVVNLGGLLGEVPFFKAVAIGDQNTANEMMRSFFGIKSR